MSGLESVVRAVMFVTVRTSVARRRWFARAVIDEPSDLDYCPSG